MAPVVGAPLVLGNWGVDTVHDRVWAVLDHNSAFAAAPEPTSIHVLGFAAVGLLLSGWGRRSRR